MVQCPKYTLLKLFAVEMFVSTRYTLTFYCMKIQTFHRFHALDCSHPLLICFPVRNRFKRKICCELVSSEEMCLFVVRPPYRPSLPMRKVPNPFTVKKKKKLFYILFAFCMFYSWLSAVEVTAGTAVCCSAVVQTQTNWISEILCFW